MSRPRLRVVQHEASCPPALLADAAARAGVDLEVVAADLGEPVPARLDGATGLVVLGGTMGVADVAHHPHLEATMELIRGAAARGTPALGICLGGQLAAHALGGRAYRAAEGLEFGWIDIELTQAGSTDPVVGALEERARVFAAHYDVFDPPPGAALLARGSDRPNQAFRLGSVVGLQFHPEVDATLAAQWHAHARAPLPCTEREVTDGAARHASKARRVLDAFCQVVAREAGA
ncbi:MAG TPA: type 1 glutamine amidotransferase [Actinomycetes bacterium]|jgi:GMP synthase (glutamine-hydrolysing)|nr:type 1 glutamine amidotransferase [Actinomycetes bacterium]